MQHTITPTESTLAACFAPHAPSDSVPTSADTGLRNSLVMMVDDEPINLDVIQAYLEDVGYRNFINVDDSKRAIDVAIQQNPDVLLLDLLMPDVSGFDILNVMKGSPRLRHIPVLVLTSSTDATTKLKALELGASDFLSKPVDPSELALRLKNTLAAKAYQDHLANYSTVLEHQVRLRTEQLEAAHKQIIHCLARAAEFRDDETGKHVVRVGHYAAVLASQLGRDNDFVSQIRVAAQLHDVGKIGIPDSVLLKPGRLDAQQFALMQNHCDLGSSIISPTDDDDVAAMARHTEIGATIMGIPDSPVMRMAAVIADTHHERWDGDGYPHGLAGEDIPVEGRITAVADVYDALSTKRPYKEAWEEERCFAVLRSERGKHFAPEVVDAFFEGVDEIRKVQATYADES